MSASAPIGVRAASGAVRVVSPRSLLPGDEILALGVPGQGESLLQLARAGLRAGVGLVVRQVTTHAGMPLVEVLLWPGVDRPADARALSIAETAVLVVVREGGGA